METNKNIHEEMAFSFTGRNRFIFQLYIMQGLDKKKLSENQGSSIVGLGHSIFLTRIAVGH